MVGSVWQHCLFVVALALPALPGSAVAAPLLYAFGPDAGAVGRDFSALDAATGAASGGVTSLGDGSLAFNGGLGFRATDQRFYAIANDSAGQSSLVSFSGSAPASYTVLNSGLGSGFVGGLAVGPDGLYALNQALDGAVSLYRYAFDGSGGTLLGGLGFYLAAGLTYNSDDGSLYAIGADALGVPNMLNQIARGPGGWTASALFALGDGSLGVNGGLAYDADADLFYAIGNDASARSRLYSFTSSGAASLSALGSDAFGDGFINAGLTLAPDHGHSASEPATLALLTIAALAWRLSMRGRLFNNACTAVPCGDQGD